MQWRQKRQTSWIRYQKTTCSIASNSGRFAWSGVGIGEGSTLRATTFLLCNFLNKKSSKIRLFYSHATYYELYGWPVIVIVIHMFGVRVSNVVICPFVSCSSQFPYVRWVANFVILIMRESYVRPCSCVRAWCFLSVSKLGTNKPPVSHNLKNDVVMTCTLSHRCTDFMEIVKFLYFAVSVYRYSATAKMN